MGTDAEQSTNRRSLPQQGAVVPASALIDSDESRRGAGLPGPEKAVYLSDGAILRRASIPDSTHVEMELLGPGGRMVMMFVCTLLLGACATATRSLPMPKYVGSVQNLQTLRASGAQAFSVANFSDAPSVNRPGSIRARAWILDLPYGTTYESFSGYLQEALKNELESAGRYREDSTLTIGGVLLDNQLDASGINIGTALLSARFNVTDAGTTIYEKTLTAESKWDSSFFGAIAIPDAVRNYIGTLQKLLYQLFADPDFQKLMATNPN